MPGVMPISSSLLGVEDGIPRVSVERLLQALLVQCMTDEADGPRQHKKAVQVADLHNVLDLSLSNASLSSKYSTPSLNVSTPPLLM